MRKQIRAFVIFSGAILLSVATGLPAWGADAASSAAPAPAASQAPQKADAADADTGPERVDTETIKEKYWARGDEAELGVVQNRLYSKAHKFEFSLLGGFDFTDPMLSVYVTGARVGYHFSEYFSAHLLGWKAFSGPSSTQTDLLSNASPGQIGTVLNTNPPSYYLGGEAQWSLLYGKLSVVGKAIIHYDLHFLAGLGTMKTQTGTDFEQHVGLGQQFFVGKSSFINVDYRLVLYHETIDQEVIPTELGQPVGTRENTSNVITVGVGFLFGSGGD